MFQSDQTPVPPPPSPCKARPRRKIAVPGRRATAGRWPNTCLHPAERGAQFLDEFRRQHVAAGFARNQHETFRRHAGSTLAKFVGAHSLIPSFSPIGGEGARRADEGWLACMGFKHYCRGGSAGSPPESLPLFSCEKQGNSNGCQAKRHAGQQVRHNAV